MDRTVVDELTELGDGIRTSFDEWKQQHEERGRDIEGLHHRLDQLDVQLQKRPSGGNVGGGGDLGRHKSRFLKLEQKCEPWFEEAKNPDVDASNVRVGALIAAIAGEDVRKQLEADELKTLAEATGPGGGYLIPPVIGSRFIDAVRPRTRVLQAGANTYPMPAPVVSFPGWADLIEAGWRPELGSFPDGGGTFRKVTLNAKMVATKVDLSIEMLQDAGDLTAIAQRVETEMGKALAQAVDLAALHGAGSDSEPLGLYNHDAESLTDINVLTLGSGNGAIPTDYDFVLDALLEAEEANFDPTALIWSPRTVNTLRKLVTGLAGDKTKLRMPDDVTALNRLITNQVKNDLTVGTSDDCSAAFLGDWSYMVVGFRPDVGVQTLSDPYTLMSNGIFRFYAYLRADIAVLQPQAFTVIKGIRA